MTGSAREGGAQPPLFLVRGDASAEEVAALVAVVRSIAGGAGPARSGRAVISEWSAPRRRVRGPHVAGPGAWRASALPH